MLWSVRCCCCLSHHYGFIKYFCEETEGKTVMHLKSSSCKQTECRSFSSPHCSSLFSLLFSIFHFLLSFFLYFICLFCSTFLFLFLSFYSLLFYFVFFLYSLSFIFFFLLSSFFVFFSILTLHPPIQLSWLFIYLFILRFVSPSLTFSFSVLFI